MSLRSGRAGGWPGRGRPNNILLMRLGLAIAVLAAHSVDLVMGHPGEPTFWLTRGQTSLGDLAVEGFMVLSGYLVAESWVVSRGVAPFLLKRVLRVYPAFVVCCLVCVLVVAPLTGGVLGGGLVRPLLIGTALLQQPVVPGALLAAPFRGSLDGSLWTISVEFACYLVLAVLGVAGLLRRPPLVHIAAWAAVLFYGGTVVLGLWTPAARLAVFFAVGAWLYMNRERVPRRGWLAAAAVAVLWASVLLPEWAVGGGGGRVGVSSFGAAEVFNLLLPFCWSYAVMWVAGAPAVPLPAWMGRNDVSYGVYLYGWPVQQVLIVAGVVVPPVLFGVALPVVVGAAAVSWLVIERPALALKRAGVDTGALRSALFRTGVDTRVGEALEAVEAASPAA